MATYRVVWTIDIDADTPVAAAHQAREIQKDPGSTATVFELFDESDECFVVDLEEEAC